MWERLGLRVGGRRIFIFDGLELGVDRGGMGWGGGERWVLGGRGFGRCEAGEKRMFKSKDVNVLSEFEFCRINICSYFIFSEM